MAAVAQRHQTRHLAALTARAGIIDSGGTRAAVAPAARLGGGQMLGRIGRSSGGDAGWHRQPNDEI